MNALGISYLVLAGVALVICCSFVAQAIIIRSDHTQAVLAVACLGFGLFDLAIAFSSECTGASQPAWVGWHYLASFAAAGLTVTIPMVGWMVLEAKMHRPRQLAVAFTFALALWRIAATVVLLRSQPIQTWESMHTLDHAYLALPSVACAVVGSGAWMVEGALGVRRGARYALPLMVFGCVAVLGSLQGVAVTLRLLPPPDLFGTLSLPAIAFVQVLSSLRFVQAFKTANQPAGDMARYEVLRQLGAGGMGDIFLARRKGPAGFLRDVVLKQLHASDDPMGKERFLAEARLAAQLSHPNIIAVYDLGEQPGGFFIVMEPISGVDLAAIIRRARALGRPIPADAVAEIGLQMCRGLSFAHAAQVIHRDIKQQNVMVSYAGVLKLIDFGIAQEAPGARAERLTTTSGAPEAPGALTADNGVIGTFGYISPERYQGVPASVASDLFSVGVVLYELLALEAPYDAQNAWAFIKAVEARSARKLDTVRSDAPPGLVTAIESCLEAAAANRPASATQLQALLEHALGGRRFELGPWVTALFAGAPDATFEKPSAPTTPALQADVPTAAMKTPTST